MKSLAMLLFILFVLQFSTYSQKLEQEWVVSSHIGNNGFTDGTFENPFKISPDGEHLASRSGASIILITNIRTGHLEAVLKASDTLLLAECIEWLDNTRLAALYYTKLIPSSQSQIIVFNTTLKESIEKIISATEPIGRCVRIDSNTIAAFRGSWDDNTTVIHNDKIHFYDITKGIVKDSIVFTHKYSLYNIASDGKYLITATTDGNIKLWDTEKKIVLKQKNISFHQAAVESMVYNNTIGCLLMKIRGSSTSVLLWDMKKDTTFSFASLSILPVARYINFSPSGNQYIVPVSYDTCYIYETSTGKKLTAFYIPDMLSPMGVVFFNNTNEILCYSQPYSNSQVKVIDPTTSEVLRILRYPENSIERVEFSTNNSYIAFLCEPNIIIADMKSGFLKQIIPSSGHNVLTFISDEVLAYTKGNSEIAYYNIKQQKEIVSFKTDNDTVMCFHYISNSDKLLVGTKEGRVIEVDINSNNSQKVVVDLGRTVFYCYYDESQQRLFTVSQHPDISGYSSGALQMFDYNSGNQLKVISPQIEVIVRSRWWRPHGDTADIAVAAFNKPTNHISVNSGSVYCWDMADTNFDGWKIYPQVSDINSLSYYPNSKANLLYTTGEEPSGVGNYNLISKVATGLTNDYPYTAHENYSPLKWLCATASYDGKYVAAGNNYGHMAVFRLSGITDVKEEVLFHQTSTPDLIFMQRSQSTISIAPWLLPCKATVFTILGKEVTTVEVTASGEIDISALHSGFYCIVLSTLNQVYSYYFVK
ncbi:MAG: WD40 repeat domain-containing protein [Candidatus Kapaibacterium sp.]|nr:WD40 repeat domain-containing protein [Bacteroidota bacterium]